MEEDHLEEAHDLVRREETEDDGGNGNENEEEVLNSDITEIEVRKVLSKMKKKESAGRRPPYSGIL